MADRQDIDALMVGALYGELSAAERTRLDAHLSSHPEDRAAMDGLETARATVRRGMTEMSPIDPPQAVSAILLQEAARRRAPTVTATEPAEREGVWERFVAWFRPLAQHPALAAAAALILVVGTASALWMRNTGKVAEPTTHSDNANGTAEMGPAQSPSLDRGAGLAAATGSGSSFEADTVATDPSNQQGAKQDKAAATAATPADERGAPGHAAGAGKGAATGRAHKPSTVDGIAVDAKADVPEVKNLDESQDSLDGDDAVGGARTTTTGAGSSPRVAPAPEPALADPQLEEWAKQQHQKLVKLVKDGKCPEAGRVGADLKAAAPDYYAANVANDRDVRQCKAYIEKSAKKKAEKDYKSRSQGNAYDDAESDDVEATE